MQIEVYMFLKEINGSTFIRILIEQLLQEILSL